MFKFTAPQKTFEIGNVKIGGQPGKTPTVLIGSLFYRGQKIVINEETGEIDKNQAESLVKLQEEYSDKTRNPCMIDLVASSDEAIVKYLDYVSEITDTPLLIDSPSHSVKITGTKHAAEVGLTDRVVYNSIIVDSKPEELETIKDSKLESALLLAYQSGFMTAKDRVNVVKKLYETSKIVGITKPIVDTFVIDVPTLSMASKAIIDIKNELGLPCGCGAHNAISTWSGFKKRMGAQAVVPCTTVANSMPVILGADFVLYGPIESCQYVFPAVSSLNSSFKYLRKISETISV